MYRLLIVDDEEFVRDGLKKFVDWDKLGYRAVYEADSAEKAMEILKNECIDTVLTDIMMYETDGLELISQISKLNPDIITIILSGYGEFEYAQKALRLGATDYLTKPVNFTEIHQVFGKVNEILANKKKRKTIQEDYFRFMSEQFLNNLVKGNYADNKIISRKSEAINLNLGPGYFRVLRFFITDAKLFEQENNDEQHYFDVKPKVSELIAQCLKKFGVCHVFNNDIKELTAVIFHNKDIEGLDTGIKHLQDEINSGIGCTVHIGVGKGYNDIVHAKESYFEAGKALEYHVFKKQSSVLHYEDVASFFTEQSVVTEDNKTVILSYLSQADSKGLLEYVITILNLINIKEKININLVYNTCIEIFLIISKFIHHSVEETIGTEENDSLTIKELLQRESIDEITDFMERYISVSMEKIKNVRKKTTGRIIEYAMKYIKEHFCEEITLSKLSEILYVHPVYISRLFKEELGENFVDYLKKIRIEKSKELLCDLSLKIYEVSEMIGYDSPKYFSKLFKDIIGITPKEYQDNYAKT